MTDRRPQGGMANAGMTPTGDIAMDALELVVTRDSQEFSSREVHSRSVTLGELRAEDLGLQ